MPIKVTCKNCGCVLHAPDDSMNKRGRCPSCGTVLSITPDSPFVPEPNVLPPQPMRPMSSPGFNLADSGPGPMPGMRPNPFPQSSGGFAPPPAPGSESSGGLMPPRPNPVLRSPDAPTAAAGFPKPTTAPGTKAPPLPDPFRKPAQAAGESELRWAKFARGLSWVQAAVVFTFLAAVACPAIEVAEKYGAKLPNHDPGYVGVLGLSAGNEIRAAATLLPLAFGLFCLVVGRFGISAVPADSGAKLPASAAALATLIAAVGFATAAGVTVFGATNGKLPKWPAAADAANDATWVQTAYDARKTLFRPPTEPAGQAQRFGLAAAAGFGVVAEVWFLAALGRAAITLRSGTAAGRVNRFLLLGGLSVLAVPLGLLGYDMAGDPLLAAVAPKWATLDAAAKTAVLGGAVALAAVVVTVLYFRVVGGLKRAARDAVA